MGRFKLTILTILLTLTASLGALSVPNLEGPVVDKAGILTSREEQELEQILIAFQNQTSAQMAVLTVKSLQGESLEGYSMEVADEWKLGQADRDNGILLLVALDERKVRLEVGYGAEGSLTDMKSGFIIREEILPYFKSGNYYGGIKQGVLTATGIVAGSTDISAEELARYQLSQNSSSSRSSSRGSSLSFFFFVLIMVLSGMGRRGRGRGGLFRALFLGSLLSNSHHRGGFGGSGGSSFGGGGFSGGGFSGGGGGFGGGGASGGW
ncbi:MAG: TPM domain-containing protein [Spirochaetales bacterium]|nr:TPM domain-containing protein [Spirochaetales bacterium]